MTKIYIDDAPQNRVWHIDNLYEEYIERRKEDPELPSIKLTADSFGFMLSPTSLSDFPPSIRNCKRGSIFTLISLNLDELILLTEFYEHKLAEPLAKGEMELRLSYGSDGVYLSLNNGWHDDLAFASLFYELGLDWVRFHVGFTGCSPEFRSLKECIEKWYVPLALLRKKGMKIDFVDSETILEEAFQRMDIGTSERVWLRDLVFRIKNGICGEGDFAKVEYMKFRELKAELSEFQKMAMEDRNKGITEWIVDYGKGRA